MHVHFRSRISKFFDCVLGKKDWPFQEGQWVTKGNDATKYRYVRVGKQWDGRNFVKLDVQLYIHAKSRF